MAGPFVGHYMATGDNPAEVMSPNIWGQPTGDISGGVFKVLGQCLEHSTELLATKKWDNPSPPGGILFHSASCSTWTRPDTYVCIFVVKFG